MAGLKIAVIVQGLFEKSDSIGYDAVFEYKLLCKAFGKANVRLFAERADPARYPDLAIGSMQDFWAFLDREQDARIIYHYCDGWPEIDEFIRSSGRSVIVRWHNNTPPWFYGANHRRSVERTIRGFRTIGSLVHEANVRFWVNSNFTLAQLLALGGDPSRISVVFPGSRFLELAQGPALIKQAGVQQPDRAGQRAGFNLLFVSRVVAHKGHRHVLRLAAYLHDVLAREVTVTFIGRDDPSAGLAADLRQLAADLGVSMALRGEVSEEDLRNAYREADLFVCYSEHEGFGMPIFEAMRMGVPVLCWGRTALRELMQHHPFTFEEIDLPGAAAAVSLLADQTFRADLAVIQQDILGIYTAETIAKQIEAALNGGNGQWPYPEIAKSSRQEAMAERVREARNALPVPTAFAPCAMDYGDNYVTLYDLESYEALLQADHGIAHLPEQPTQTDHAWFGFREFVAPAGRKLEEGLLVSGSRQGPTSYSVYGPYAKFIRGYFAAEFEIEVEQAGDPQVELELDVAIEGGGVVASANRSAAMLREESCTQLLFPVSNDNSVVEFRIKVRRHGNCGFLFKGVRIRNMRQSLKALGDQEAIGDFLPRWLPRKRRKLLPAFSLPAAATQHFARADGCRDRGFWNDAAEAYATGLKLAPDAFAYHVQRGNCLKEAARYEESERSYLDALALDPDHRDANLQLGRLYRLTGRAEAAHYHLLKAARLETAAADAMHELAGLGFDISALPELFT